jgi:hypothetical protein
VLSQRQRVHHRRHTEAQGERIRAKSSSQEPIVASSTCRVPPSRRMIAELAEPTNHSIWLVPALPAAGVAYPHAECGSTAAAVTQTAVRSI